MILRCRGINTTCFVWWGIAPSINKISGGPMAYVAIFINDMVNILSKILLYKTFK